MANWQPLSREKLDVMIADSVWLMDDAVQRFWRRIAVEPTKWQLSPWGDAGAGFWVVAIIGHQCVWYNDIEGGFNISRWSVFGSIQDYAANQSELAPFITSIYREF